MKERERTHCLVNLLHQILSRALEGRSNCGPGLWTMEAGGINLLLARSPTSQAGGEGVGPSAL